MKILMMTDVTGTSAYLTTDSEYSTNGVPVLQINNNESSRDYNARDVIGTIPYTTSAAAVVITWLAEPGRTEEEKLAGELFLGSIMGKGAPPNKKGKENKSESNEPEGEPHKGYILRDIPYNLWRKTRIRAAEEGLSVRELVLKAMQHYLDSL